MSARHRFDGPTPRRLAWLTPRVRRYLYDVALTAAPLLVAYGALSESRAPLWLALAATVLGVGTARVHTPAA